MKAYLAYLRRSPHHYVPMILALTALVLAIASLVIA